MSETLKKSISSWFVAIALAIVLSISFASIFGYSSYDVDGFRLGIGIVPSGIGETEFSIPPFGEITASTHNAPIRIKVVFERIYPNEISQVAGEIDDGEELVRKIEEEAKKAFKQFILGILALAALGGAVGAAVFPRKRLYKAAVGILVGTAIMGLLVFQTYRTFDIHAFKQPRYSGALSAAPWATEAIAKRLADIKTFRKEIRDIARNVNLFYSKIDSWQPLEKDVTKVLHVSDIHNNPAAIDLIRRVVADFKIDMIIDTGDITDFGTPLETKLIEGISSIPVPYVYIPGNHDSTETVAFMRRTKNVTVVENSLINLNGITIYGVPDPAASAFDPSPADDATMAALRFEIMDKLKAFPKNPLILAAHNPKMVKDIMGKVPIILVGHNHKAEVKEKNGFVLSNAGTTGAAGIRTFQVQEGVPYTLNILHISPTPRKLVAIDSIEVIGLKREFRLERKLIEGKTVSEIELEAPSKEE